MDLIEGLQKYFQLFYKGRGTPDPSTRVGVLKEFRFQDPYPYSHIPLPKPWGFARPLSITKYKAYNAASKHFKYIE